MSSKFHVFQLWCTKCLLEGTAAFRNTPSFLCFFAPGTGEIQKQSGAPRNRLYPSTGMSKKHCTAFRTTLKMPCLKYWRDSKHGGSLSPAESHSPKYWQFLNAVMTVHNAFPQVLAGVTAESHSPKYGHFQNPPYCIQNHAENALPQVLTEFRISQRHGGIAFPQTTPTSGIQNQSREWRNRFPKSNGGSWTHRAGWPFPGCGVAGRCEGRHTVFANRE